MEKLTSDEGGKIEVEEDWLRILEIPRYNYITLFNHTQKSSLHKLAGVGELPFLLHVHPNPTQNSTNRITYQELLHCPKLTLYSSMGFGTKVLVVGGTGYLGKRFVKASLAQGHETYVLQRPEIGLDIDKVQMLLSFKEQGAHLIEASFSDHQSLVNAVKQVDVVISAMSGVHHRSHNLLVQLKLVAAIKEAGNIKRFLPSEFGIDAARMENALEPGRVTFDEKMEVRKAIEEAGIPFTYVSANCFNGYFLGSLCQMATALPSREKVCLWGDGNVKAIFMDEDDIATYTVKTIDDPRTLNKIVYLRPPENIMSQREVVETWERHIGKELHKSSISEEQFLTDMKGMDLVSHIGACHFYQVFFEGCLTNFEVSEGAEEASKLYPEVNYVRVGEYMKRYV